MPFPIKVCSVCEEEFELKPDKPGFANRCPECSEPEASVETTTKRPMDAVERKTQAEANQARRDAMRNLLYRKDS
jgi:predicted amidophosphoribosyltransferase